MNYVDWKIHRKLDEARTVYIYPARGSGRTQPLHEIIDALTDSGKKVHVVTSPDLPKRNLGVQQIKELIPDFDLYGAWPWWRTRDEDVWETLTKHFKPDESGDNTKSIMICTSNPYGRPWII